MDPVLFFPFAEYWWIYLVFTGLILLLLLLDLGVFHRTAHEVKLREAFIWTIVWILFSFACNGLLYWYAKNTFPFDPRLISQPNFNPDAAASQIALEFLTGYVVEKCLAIDNIFVFALVFSYFAIPAKYQHRVLFYGILGALVFRGIFIAMGSYLMQFQWVVWFFGALLIVSGIKMLFVANDKIEPDKNPVIKLITKFLPVKKEFVGESFFIKENGKLYVTPLFVALCFLEISDIIFAIDSVPAIFALTKEPLIVFSSNMCAILGLRAMYFLLAGVLDRFHLIKYGLSLVLVFVGLKMVWLNDLYGGKFPIGYSLGIIAALITIPIIISLLTYKRDQPSLKQ